MAALVFGEVEAGKAEQSLTSASEEDKELFVIFPAIFLLQDAPPYSVTSGIALVKSESVAAAEEIERKSLSSPTAGKTVPRHKPARSWTKSISLNGGKDV